jgi:hypothetical protein
MLKDLSYALRDLLHHTKDAFQDWRYIFEDRDKTVRFYGLHHLCTALRAYILELQPEWTVHASAHSTALT